MDKTPSSSAAMMKKKKSSEEEMAAQVSWNMSEERICCDKIKIQKIGNIFILAEWPRADGKKRRIVLGPYWHFLLVTLVVILSVSLMIYVVVIPTVFIAERVIGLSLTVLSASSLLCTALTDPGIFPRYSAPLAASWTYSEYAQSYRPPGVIYCQQCHVLIEDYNHFCPWSGIVIGKGNEAYFQVFIVAIVTVLLWDILIVVLSLYGLGF
uniref:Palmitoyltransferase n=1 Tax=Aureoumbra lagunensis TaxID=44058 RepID=A0A7S3K3M6_9STRA|mmetsp:Transcript_22022/g.33989  ORF Transcript_22022/g.33989 Transcript_22022/m.33989 type:complete len:210 (+) Transcript_22022:67-696(+)